MRALSQTYEPVNYGKVVLTLGELMDKQGITRNKLRSATNTHYDVVSKYYYGKVERVDLDVLARICFALNCPVSDVLRFEPPEE